MRRKFGHIMSELVGFITNSESVIAGQDHEHQTRHTSRAGAKDKASVQDIKGFRAPKEEICMEFREGHWQESLCNAKDCRLTVFCLYLCWKLWYYMEHRMFEMYFALLQRTDFGG